MKLTKKEEKPFMEISDKWLSEGNFLTRLFARRVAKSIENDPDIKKAISDADKALEKTKTNIEKSLKGDREAVKSAIPADVRKYLGFDY
jgi:viroplasmin and RNaseH domain-containing protein